MKKLFAIESVRGVLISAARTKKKAALELRKANRRGVKAKIVPYTAG